MRWTHRAPCNLHACSVLVFKSLVKQTPHVKHKIRTLLDDCFLSFTGRWQLVNTFCMGLDLGVFFFFISFLFCSVDLA